MNLERSAKVEVRDRKSDLDQVRVASIAELRAQSSEQWSLSMAAQASITVFDGASTPVSHTFTGEEVARLVDGSVKASWKETSLTLPDYACNRITITKRKLKNGMTRVEVSVEIPVMEAVNAQNSSGYTAPPKVAHVVKESLVVFRHERSTETDARLARMILVNVANNISTSVAAATSGPVSDAVDKYILPT